MANAPLSPNSLRGTREVLDRMRSPPRSSPTVLSHNARNGARSISSESMKSRRSSPQHSVAGYLDMSGQFPPAPLSSVPDEYDQIVTQWQVLQANGTVAFTACL